MSLRRVFGFVGGVVLGAMLIGPAGSVVAQVIRLNDGTPAMKVAVYSLDGSAGSVGGGSGTAMDDDAAFTPGTSDVSPAGFVFDDVAPDSVNEGDVGAGRMSANRNQYVTLRDAAGNERGANISANNELATTIGAAGVVMTVFDYTNSNAAGVVIVDPATGDALTLATDVTEDAAETAGGKGPMVLSVRRDTMASSAGTTGDNATFNTSSTGALYVQPAAGISGGADGLKYTSAGSTEDEHAVKTSAGILYSITATNTNAAARYLRCENDTAGNTSPGSETPELDLAIPGATTGAGITFSFPVGFQFSTALTCWLVTGAADTDVAEVAANEIKVFYTFK